MTDTTTKGWAPVVYGRTLNADSWWRAVPAGTGTDGWLDTAVNAAVDGGNTLADGPRFLLSRSHGRLLVGVACRAADLHAEMNQHKGRALHCFVGWLAPAAAVGGPVAPRLSDLETHYRQWAGELYAKWVGPDWDEHRAKLRGPRPSGPVDVPWTGGSGRSAPTGSSRTGRTARSSWHRRPNGSACGRRRSPRPARPRW
ncbi:hypothetical protein ACFQ1L_46315 [Phytohabitans flavus]|uniref:hypothetical protein n=1 Tax=Phytohabitans flavus TaxID=1076124 RepID=UPI00363EEDD6